MTRFLGAAVILLASVLTVADFAGVWTLSWEPDFGGIPNAYDCTFKQEGRSLTVTCPQDMVMNGDIDGQQVTIRLKTGRDDNENATLTGELNQQGTQITGEWHLLEQKRSGKFVARKRQ
jgi:hypothetical protein